MTSDKICTYCSFNFTFLIFCEVCNKHYCYKHFKEYEAMRNTEMHPHSLMQVINSASENNHAVS